MLVTQHRLDVLVTGLVSDMTARAEPPIWPEAWLSPCPLVLRRNWAICVARDGWLGQK
jgi:hypothetical protein